MDRRSFLLGAISISPISSFLLSDFAFADETQAGSFMQASWVVIGRKDLSPDIAGRIEVLLKQRIADYDQKFAALTQALSPAIQDEKLRNDALKGLSAADTAFALEIAKPWYLGYVGTAAGSSLKDDATFVTYLNAQAYEVVLKDLPRTSYPPGGRGWWQAVPAGVDSPTMPDRVIDWTWQPDGATGVIAKPDPAWQAYAMGEFPSLDAARAAHGTPSAHTNQQQNKQTGQTGQTEVNHG